MPSQKVLAAGDWQAGAVLYPEPLRGKVNKVDDIIFNSAFFV
jgi:hypothetical protein